MIEFQQQSHDLCARFGIRNRFTLHKLLRSFSSSTFYSKTSQVCPSNNRLEFFRLSLPNFLINMTNHPLFKISLMNFLFSWLACSWYPLFPSKIVCYRGIILYKLYLFCINSLHNYLLYGSLWNNYLLNGSIWTKYLLIFSIISLL